MSHNTVLITGGTGFAGSHLSEFLLTQDPTCQIYITQSRRSHHATSQNTKPSSDATAHSERVHHHQVDLTEPVACIQLFRDVQPTHIYHLASHAVVAGSFSAAPEILQKNIAIQLSLLEAYRQVSPKAKFLSVGSAEVYGAVQLPSAPDFNPNKNSDSGSSMTSENTQIQEHYSQAFPHGLSENLPHHPTNPYAISKSTQEMLSLMYQRAYNLPLVCVRAFNHTGEYQKPLFAIPAFAQQIIAIERGQKDVLRVGNLSAVRDISDVKDIVRGYSMILAHGDAGTVYNLGSGQGRMMSEYLDILLQHAQTPITIEIDPEKMRPSDTPWSVADTRSITTLGWQPTIPITQTLERVLNYWRSL